MKRCTKCLVFRPKDMYTKAKDGKEGLRAICKPCAAIVRKVYKSSIRGFNLRFKYGLEYDDFIALLRKQNGGCAICGKTSEENGRVLCVDHCHFPGYDRLPLRERRQYVRGLLCDRCNTCIGHMQDNAMMLRSAANYVEAFAATRNPPPQ